MTAMKAVAEEVSVDLGCLWQPELDMVLLTAVQISRNRSAGMKEIAAF